MSGPGSTEPTGLTGETDDKGASHAAAWKDTDNVAGTAAEVKTGESDITPEVQLAMVKAPFVQSRLIEAANLRSSAKVAESENDTDRVKHFESEADAYEADAVKRALRARYIAEDPEGKLKQALSSYMGGNPDEYVDKKVREYEARKAEHPSLWEGIDLTARVRYELSYAAGDVKDTSEIMVGVKKVPNIETLLALRKFLGILTVPHAARDYLDDEVAKLGWTLTIEELRAMVKEAETQQPE
ncbi:hypothetical protein FWD20_02640 [Candidatus Saccharibacteria bacterium]|nr:hypothetical protein [Candidatus Saccharibacteria bacterium]